MIIYKNDTVTFSCNIDFKNNFVRITFDLITNPESITCIFVGTGQIQNHQKSCEISIANNCQMDVTTYVRKRNDQLSLDNKITIELNDLLEDIEDLFCYNLTASDGNDQVIVRGEQTIGMTLKSSIGSGAIASITLVVILIAVFLPPTVILIILIALVSE